VSSNERRPALNPARPAVRAAGCLPLLQKTIRAVREHQITQVTKPHANTSLDLVTFPIKETKKEKTSFFLDTGATLTLVKIGNLKDDTKMRDERIALTGVTGHKIYTLGKIRATIPLGEQKIRHTMYVVKDDFIDYEGILGIDFLTKQQTKCDYGKKKLRIGDVTLKLHPHQKMLLAARSETIVQAITDRNSLGIIKSEEAKPGIFIGTCLVKPEEYACPVSIINTTEESVEITTPLVTLSEIQTGE